MERSSWNETDVLDSWQARLPGTVGYAVSSFYKESMIPTQEMLHDKASRHDETDPTTGQVIRIWTRKE
jgi:hypothetical protein